MVESKYVLHGLIAGAVSGVIVGIITFLNMPSVDEVLKTVERYGGAGGLSGEILRGYLSIVLMLSPLIAFVFSLVLGAVFGALYDYLDKKIKVNVLLTAALTGAIFWTVLVVPNMVLGASSGKIITNTVWALSYTVVLLILAVVNNPRTQ